MYQKKEGRRGGVAGPSAMAIVPVLTPRRCLTVNHKKDISCLLKNSPACGWKVCAFKNTRANWRDPSNAAGSGLMSAGRGENDNLMPKI